MQLSGLRFLYDNSNRNASLAGEHLICFTFAVRS